jgi:hypothetical protein
MDEGRAEEKSLDSGPGLATPVQSRIHFQGTLQRHARPKVLRLDWICTASHVQQNGQPIDLTIQNGPVDCSPRPAIYNRPWHQSNTVRVS